VKFHETAVLSIKKKISPPSIPEDKQEGSDIGIKAGARFTVASPKAEGFCI